MRKTTLFIGLNDRDTKTQLISTNRAKTIVGLTVGDCTLEMVEGVYKNIQEKTIKVTLIDFQKDIKMIVNRLKTLLNQECILVTNETIQAEFI